MKWDGVERPLNTPRYCKHTVTGDVYKVITKPFISAIDHFGLSVREEGGSLLPYDLLIDISPLEALGSQADD
jgi:hypothetical protein